MAERYLLISAGQGPAECGWVVDRLTDALQRDFKAAGVSARVADVQEGESGTVKSVILVLDGGGDSVEAAAGPLCGTHQWIGRSPFRPRHKRRNWFVGVRLLPAPETVPALRE